MGSERWRGWNDVLMEKVVDTNLPGSKFWRRGCILGVFAVYSDSPKHPFSIHDRRRLRMAH